MVNSFIAKKDLDSEMTVVRNEFELGENDPGNILSERVLSTAYLWHNYGHSTIGARADIENVPIERLQAFYRNYYQPDNAVLLVAGRFDEAKTLALINNAFGRIQKPTRALITTYTAEPAQDGERRVELRRVGDLQAVAVVYHVPAGAHPDAAAVGVLDAILADEPSGRLYKALVETHKASSVHSQYLYLHDPGFLAIGAEVRQESSLSDAQSTLLQTLDQAVSQPVTKEEVDRARGTLLKQIDLTLNSVDRVGLELSEWIGAGDWRLFFLNRDRIKAATVEDVQRVAGALLEAVEPDGRHLRSDSQARSRGDSEPRPIWRLSFRTTRVKPPLRPARRSIHRRPTSTQRRSVQHSRTACRCRSCPRRRAVRRSWRRSRCDLATSSV